MLVIIFTSPTYRAINNNVLNIIIICKIYYITIEIQDREYIEYINNIENSIREVLCDDLLDEAIILEPIDLK